MQKNKALAYTIVFCLLVITFKVWIFYSGRLMTKVGMFSHLITLACLLPFCLLLIKSILDTSEEMLGGQSIFKFSLKYILFAIVIISVFNYVFYEAVMGEFIRNYILEKGPESIRKHAAEAKIPITEEKIKEQLDSQIAATTAFKDTMGKLLSMLIFGAFFTFIGTLVFKRKAQV